MNPNGKVTIRPESGRLTRILHGALMMTLFSAGLSGAVSISGTVTTAEWPWYAPYAYTKVTYPFSGTIADRVDVHGNIAASGARTSWREVGGAALQGDARYSGFTGSFELRVDYHVVPAQAVTAVVMTVHFTKGVLDGAWPGEGVNGAVGRTGNLSVNQIERDDPERLERAGDPIELATGASVESRTLFSFHGARDWSFGIGYNSALASLDAGDGPIGAGWNHPFEARIVQQGANLAVKWNLTRFNVFIPKLGEAGVYVSNDPVMARDTMTALTDGGWRLNRPDQTALRFNAAGRLVEDIDAHGRRLVLNYDNASRLAGIVEPISGTRLTFGYGAGALIGTITDGGGAVVKLEYELASSLSQLLTRVTNQNGKATTFAYGANRALLTARDPAGRVVMSNSYDALGRVILQSNGVAGSRPLEIKYTEHGLPRNTLYANSDRDHRVPLILPDPGLLRTETFTNLQGESVQNAFDLQTGALTAATVAGQTTLLKYDASGHVSAIVDPAGEVTLVTPGVSVSLTDRNGRTAVHEYDAEFNLRAQTNPLRQTTRYAYDRWHKLTTITDPLDRITRFTYDEAGNVTSMIDPAGGVTRHSYDARNNLLSVTDALGRTLTRTYDAANNLLTEIDPVGGRTEWTYDANSLPVSLTSPEGRKTRFDYTAGRLTRMVDATGGVSTFGYDAAGRLLYGEDAAGGRVTNVYDAIGNVRTISDSVHAQSNYEYDDRNRLVRFTDPVGAITSYDYDASGALRSSTDANGNVTAYSYDGESRLIAMENALHQVTRFDRNEVGQLIAVTDPAGNQTVFEFDAAGQAALVVDPMGRRIAQEFDSQGALIRVVDQLGRSMSFDRDQLGRLVGITDRLGRRASTGYDLLGRVNRFEDAGGLVATQKFDRDGKRTAVTNPTGRATSFSYDGAGQLASMTMPEGEENRYLLDHRGLPTQKLEASGAETRYEYDVAGRCVKRTDGLGAIEWTYDACGRVLTTREGDKVITRAYDLLGRLTSFQDGDGNRMGYDYDGLGRLRQLTYPEGQKVNYSYDLAGRLDAVTDWAGRVTRYRYNAGGEVTELVRANGTRQLRSYDGVGQLIRVADYARNTETLIASTDYEYDAGGQLTRSVSDYALDASMPNLVQTFDGDDRLLTHNAAMVGTDADGNLLSISSGLKPANFSYDQRHRLIRADELAYRYDAEDRRTGVVQPDGAVTEIFNPNARLEQLLVRSGPNGQKTYYVYGHELLHEETAGVLRCYHADGRGDMVALTAADGTVSARASYGAYGEELGQNGDWTTPFRAGGAWGIQTDDNNLRYHRARYYHPGLRRFLSRDPNLGDIQSPGSLNRYAYAMGNPLRFVDPTGYYNEDVHFDLTMSLAIRAGFSREEAFDIACADQGMDSAPDTNPYASAEARRDYHFTTAERRQEMLQAAYTAKSLNLFGEYLHAEQDSFSHQRGKTDRDGEPYDYKDGHLRAGVSPDLTHLRPELAVRMAQQTYTRLRKFYEHIHGRKSCDDWENVRPAVEHWVRIKK